MRIANNVPALFTQIQLQRNDRMMAASMRRLSTGFRINSARDDAAGIAISNKLSFQLTGLERASDNSTHGVSLVQTAEGAMNEIHAMLQRMRELSVQAANDTLVTQDRIAIQREIADLTAEISMLSNRAEFNTIKLLGGEAARVASSWMSIDGGAREFLRGVTPPGFDFTSTNPISNNLPADIEINGTTITIPAGTTISAFYAILAANGLTTNPPLNATTNPNTVYELRDANGNKFTIGGDLDVWASIGMRVPGPMQQTRTWANHLFISQAVPAGTLQYTVTSPARPAIMMGSQLPDGVTIFPPATAPAPAFDLNTVINPGGVLRINGVEITISSGDTIGGMLHALTEASEAAGIRFNQPQAGGFFTMESVRLGEHEKIEVSGDRHLWDILGITLTSNVSANVDPTVPRDVYKVTAPDVHSMANPFDPARVIDGTPLDVQVNGQNITIPAGTTWGDLVDPNGIFSGILEFTPTPTAPGAVYEIRHAQGGPFHISGDRSVWEGLGVISPVIHHFSAIEHGKDVELDNVRYVGPAPNYATTPSVDRFNTTMNIRTEGNKVFVVGSDGMRIEFVVDKPGIFSYTNATPYSSVPLNSTFRPPFGTFTINGVDITIDNSINDINDLITLIGNQLQSQTPPIPITFNTDPNNPNSWRMENAAGDIILSGDLKILEFLGFADPAAASKVDMELRVEDIGGLRIQTGPNHNMNLAIEIPRVNSETLGLTDNLGGRETILLHLTTREGADRAIGQLDWAIERTSMIRGRLGGYQNRLEHTIRNLDNSAENTASARSRIRDTNMAREMTEYSKRQVMYQAGVSILGQANQRPQMIMTLLQ